MFTNDQFLILFGQAKFLPVPSTLPISAADRESITREVMLSHPLEIVDYLQRLSDRGMGGAKHPQYAVHIDPSVRPNAFAAVVANYPLPWFHLIYAYLLENTRIYELFQRVIDGFVHGETLGVASADSLKWLRTTEAIFYRQQAAHDHSTVITLTSDMRSDGRAIRRNAYFRMFGMDLNHGTNDNKPYPYQKPKLSNHEFVPTLESLLRELWIAFINRTTTVSDPTDEGAIISYTNQLRTMLQNRRLNQTLTIEEFSAVATLGWLRLAISQNTPIVNDLRASATSEAERLQKIAERVNLPHHGKSEEYFELAAPLAGFLQEIENGTLTDTASYLALGQQLLTIITHWSNATGKVLKRLPQQIAKTAAA